MEFFPSRTTFLRVGPLTIQWYAILILTGAIVAYFFSKKNLKQYRNIDVNGFFDDMFIYVLWGGVIGARLWYCLFDSNFNYLEDPLQIIKIWDGGVAFHGCFAGGLLVALLFCKKRNVSFVKFADAVVPTVLFAQAMGRWGNFINQECYGQTVNESYYDGILSFLKSGMYIHGEYREPMFFYESCLCLLGFILINFVLRKFQNKRGDLAWAYLMWYGVVRFFIEARRTDSLLMNISGLKTAQVTSVIYVIIGILGFVGVFDKLFKKKKPTLLFDLDGTLIDTEEPIQMSYRELYRRYDDEKNFTDEIATEVLGPGLMEMFAKLFPNEDPNKLFKEYKEINNSLLPDYLRPMPNAMETLEILKQDGYHIGAVTTRTHDSAEQCLKLIGMDKYMEDICGIDDVKKSKPDPEGYGKIIDKNKWNKSDIVVIGDSIADINGGKNYGCFTVAYIFNKNKTAKVVECGPDRQISDIKELLDILKEDINFTYNGK
ncbi:MAG: prolipoprotein diacylglyceryl transferase [Erysipelotrichaceae bacterium]|nr:prolipoprotein diacylglyceryl transferase [Erysipelotrichaceae bacterium]